MSTFHVIYTDSVDQHQINLLLENVVFKDYIHYHNFNRKQALKYLRGTVQTIMSAAKSWLCYARGKGSQPIGLVIVEPLFWESSFFGLQMARINLLLCRHPTAEYYPIAAALLNTALEGAREAGLEHLSVRIDVDNLCLMHALEDTGFRLMDTLCTYIFEQGQELPTCKDKRYMTRNYRPDDYQAVLDVATTAFKGYPNRFSVDPHLNDEQAGKFYLEWTKKFCRGKQMEQLIVAEKKDRVIGFLGWQSNQDLYRLTGKRVVGRGLGACYPLRFNGYYDLLHEATRRALQTADSCEYDTQSFNMATMNLYQQLGFRFVRAKYTLHCWLGTTDKDQGYAN